MLDACGSPCESQDILKTKAGLIHLFEKLHIAHCDKEGKWVAAPEGPPLMWAAHLATDAQLEAEAPVRKLEELRPQKDMQLSTIPLGLSERMGEQDNRLEDLMVNFAKL